MPCGEWWRWRAGGLAEVEPFDKGHHLGGQASPAPVGTDLSTERPQSTCSVPRQPSTSGAKCDSPFGCRLSQENAVLEVRPQDGEPCHCLLPLLVGKCR